MSIKLILVDDHILFLEGLHSILSKEIGIEILGKAKDGLELFQLIKQGSVPDIVVSDIRMPILDGIDIAKLLKKEYPNIKIIALTMLDQESEVINMLDAGAKGYVVKNADKKELIDAINNVALGNHYISKRFEGIYERWGAKEQATEEVKLTRRERQILELIVRGKTSLQMAKELHLSHHTIDTHRKNIHKKIGIKSNVALVKHAQKWLNM